MPRRGRATVPTSWLFRWWSTSIVVVLLLAVCPGSTLAVIEPDLLLLDISAASAQSVDEWYNTVDDGPNCGSSSTSIVFSDEYGYNFPGVSTAYMDCGDVLLDGRSCTYLYLILFVVLLVN